MLQFYIGTDREKVRAELKKSLAAEKGVRIAWITDANTVADLQEALRGAGMFGERRVVVLDSVLQNDEMREVTLGSLQAMRTSNEKFFILEEKPDADTRRAIEKHAEKAVRFDAPKKEKDKSVFALANALRRADKKALWIGYQRELTKGVSPENIHGVLFWGAKDMLLKSRAGSAENRRASALIAELAELPHEARRNNIRLEHALERFVLCLAR